MFKSQEKVHTSQAAASACKTSHSSGWICGRAWSFLSSCLPLAWSGLLGCKDKGVAAHPLLWSPDRSVSELIPAVPTSETSPLKQRWPLPPLHLDFTLLLPGLAVLPSMLHPWGMCAPQCTLGCASTPDSFRSQWHKCPVTSLMSVGCKSNKQSCSLLSAGRWTNIWGSEETATPSHSPALQAKTGTN